MKSKKQVIKNIAKKVSIPTHAKADKAKPILNLQIGKVILQIKKE